MGIETVGIVYCSREMDGIDIVVIGVGVSMAGVMAGVSGTLTSGTSGIAAASSGIVDDDGLMDISCFTQGNSSEGGLDAADVSDDAEEPDVKLYGTDS